MDGVSVAASVLAIATAGIQISLKLVSFSHETATASDRIRLIGSDVSITANVLQQLSELMVKREGDVSIFNEDGLQNTQASANACETIFRALEDALKSASKQLRQQTATAPGRKIVLSKRETLTWPFLRPEVDRLHAALKDARETLMLILQVTTLAYSRKLARMNKSSALTADDRSLLEGAIVALHQANETPRSEPESFENSTIYEGDSTTKRFKNSTPHALNRGTELDETSSHQAPIDALDTYCTKDIRAGALNAPSSPDQLPNSGVQQLVSPAAKPKGAVQDPSPPLIDGRNGRTYSTSVLEAWDIWPKTASEPRSYTIRWHANKRPSEHGEFKRRRLTKLFRLGRGENVPKQLENLSPKERETVEECIFNGRAVPPNLKILGITFHNMTPSKNPNISMPQRTVRIFVETFSDAPVDRNQLNVVSDDYSYVFGSATLNRPGFRSRRRNRPCGRATSLSFTEHKTDKPFGAIPYAKPLEIRVLSPDTVPTSPPVAIRREAAPSESREQEAARIVDELLRKYTTLSI